ncbi:histidine kinase [Natronorubrum thiooxidans]|uniref:Diguanylate Cyclase and Two-component system sensory domain-containing protein n=1 Tax=Natronorubrum thiooxidans TaxID=308853 RepID=A0A1N7CIW2_9EURY|nr:histidine kinase [Natronorubrum thiooxidans]SIR63578.1 hypothetical protein SAMN05421752_101394 [Natronorubrum thiooxidans]
MTLRSFIEDTGPPTATIAVVGDDQPGPLEAMLDETFETQSITVETSTSDAIEFTGEFDLELEADGGDIAVLLEDGVPVATSSMADLYESLLAINSDLFVTGTRGLGEIEFPEVLANLDETKLRLRGSPVAHKEKLLLIIVSRRIEQLAWNGNGGTLRSAVQQLSRITDEIGTHEVYTELAASDVDVHVYGVDDAAIDLDVTVHSGTEQRYRNAWFVVYRPDDPADGDGSALVCLEDEPRVWDGF